jgi:hypothetical protein
MPQAHRNRPRIAFGLACAACALFLAIAAPASEAVVINFDDQASGTVLDEQYSALGVHFGPSPFQGQSGKVTAVARGQAHSAPNVAAFDYDLGADFSSSWIRFDKPQRKVSFYACRTGGAGDPARPNVNVDAYDSAGSMIDNQQGIECDLNGQLAPVVVEQPNITYVHVAATGGSPAPGPGWGLDDLQYELDPPPPPDRDGDGVSDDTDNCPDDANADQADADGNGIGTVCDPDEDVVGSCLDPDVAPNLIGTPGPDDLIGTGGNDQLSGLAGDDCLAGLGGNDDLDGDSGRDILYGGTGNDRLQGGSGADRTIGGTGNDSISGSAGDDRLLGDSGNDRISGGSGRDLVSGGSGNDSVAARDGSRDRILCGSGRDLVSADRADEVSRDCERVTRR